MPGACLNLVRPMAEQEVSEQTVQTVAQQPDIRVTLLLHGIPVKTEALMPTRADHITSSAQATLYDARPSSHWGINE